LSRLAWAYSHETLIWASRGRGHTFNYDLINGPDPTTTGGPRVRAPRRWHPDWYAGTRARAALGQAEELRRVLEIERRIDDLRASLE
jgi:hypothetical protein